MNPKTTEQTTLPPLPDPRAVNSLKHGILSELVPLSERAAYAEHVAQVRESSGARTYLEQRLADRAALAFWRLDRVARWEALELEREQRQFYDRLQSSKPPGSEFSGLLPPKPLDARNLHESLRALSDLTGEVHTAFLNDPQDAASYADSEDLEATSWAAILDGADLNTLSAEQVEVIGFGLLSALVDTWNVSPARLARLLLGRKPTPQEIEDTTDASLGIERADLPTLLKEAARAAGSGWRAWLTTQRYGAIGKAGKIRAIAARLPLLIEQELAQATMPDGKTLEKVTRYEAHLERVLYRALHELEAARQAREGGPTLPPIRGVLDERGQDDG